MVIDVSTISYSRRKLNVYMQCVCVYACAPPHDDLPQTDEVAVFGPRQDVDLAQKVLWKPVNLGYNLQFLQCHRLLRDGVLGLCDTVRMIRKSLQYLIVVTLFVKQEDTMRVAFQFDCLSCNHI